MVGLFSDILELELYDITYICSVELGNESKWSFPTQKEKKSDLFQG